MLPRVFRSPARWWVTSGDALFFLNPMVRMRISWFATIDICDAPRVFHDAVAELSLQTPVCIHLVGRTHSNTSHPRTSSSI